MTYDRPWVIRSVTATGDGRVTLGRATRLSRRHVAARWRVRWPPGLDDPRVEADA
ncbi:hypothetical protein [Asanoa siamensis]|uniref:Uncharacterized protein n=1 Tax=Asanoa siamensis TaxID=926357 RepID=A0ABQ4D4K5_9ACTN|nr:hypothetical protein [Asanoa siamensis]GIF78468.1 hypothetical protein Asi02nite_79860 [Asanoa siamensis]